MLPNQQTRSALPALAKDASVVLSDLNRLDKLRMSKASQRGETPAKEIVLVVDDDESVRRALVWTLNSDYRVLEASSRLEAVKLLQEENVDMVISDLHLPPRLDDISEGLAIIEAARKLPRRFR